MSESVRRSVMSPLLLALASAVVVVLFFAIVMTRLARPRVRPILVDELYDGRMADVFARSRQPTMDPFRGAVARRALFVARVATEVGDHDTAELLLDAVDRVLSAPDDDVPLQSEERADCDATVALDDQAVAAFRALPAAEITPARHAPGALDPDPGARDSQG